jgi:2-oxo-4-hydroxy-4-carboxy--5-ureidoimidazoline (OHCU) decarboxylase
MSEGISYKEILSGHNHYSKGSKKKALRKQAKGGLTGRSQKEQMRFTKQNRDYQKKFGRAWND